MLLTLLGIIVLTGLAFWLIFLRRVVDANCADVVVGKHGTRIYTGDASVVPTGQKTNPIYYAFPSWVPYLGVTVQRMPLSIINIVVKDYETFAKGNPRFVIDVTVYCKIIDIAEAARRFPGRKISDFQDGMKEIVISAIRKTTANYSIEDVIAKREEISADLTRELAPDFTKWGVELTNVAIVSIRDPIDGSSTVIHDISAKMEAQINSNSRQEVANRNRDAEIVEADTFEIAEKRKIEAKEHVDMREQDRIMEVAKREKVATEERMNVYRIKEVQKAEIDAEAAVRRAEGEKRAMVETATGNRERLALEGEGEAKKIEFEGKAKANVTEITMVAEANGNKAKLIAAAEGTKAQLFAEADGMMEKAKAQEYQQTNAQAIRMIEKDERVGLALAEALKAADVQYIGSGNPENFLDLFTVKGGLGIGGMLKALNAAEPDATEKIASLIKSVVDRSEKPPADSNGDNPAKPEPVATAEPTENTVPVPPKASLDALATVAEQFLGSLNEKKEVPPKAPKRNSDFF